MANKLERTIKKYKTRAHWISYVAKEGGVSVFEAQRLMKDARDKHGISYEKFAKEDVIKCGSAEEREKKIKKLLDLQEGYITKTVEATGWSREQAEAEMKRAKKQYGITFYEYYYNQLYEMTPEEQGNWKKNRKKHKDEIVRYAMQESGWSEERVRSHMAECNARYTILPDVYKNDRCWELSDDQLARLATDKDSVALSAKYNKNVKKLVDKACFDEVYSEFTGRKFWLNEKGAAFESFLEFTYGVKRLFYKPVDLSCGIGAGSIELGDEEASKRQVYDGLMGKDLLLVEEYIEQHPEMSAVYPGSVNTIRVTNLETPDGEVHHILAFVRFGTKPGVDNFKNGGIAAAVDIETGEVITDAKDNAANVYEVHPVSGVKIKGFRIPMWDKVLELTDNALRKDPDINYVGWDVAVRSDGPVLVEGNSKPQCSTYQSLFDSKTEGKRHLYEEYL
jgi:hypothetical protein